MKTNPPKIIVVGAGAAGLYAAYKLKKAGANVAILESTKLHGGRIRELNRFSEKFQIMLGAEYLQGNACRRDEPISFLNRDICLYYPELLVATGCLKSIYEIDGHLIWDEFENNEIEKVKKFLNSAYKYKGCDISVAEYLKEIGINHTTRTWHLYEAWIGSEYGTSINKISMKGWAKERNVNLTGDNEWLLNESYLKILDKLYFKEVLVNILFGRKVVKINYSDAIIEVMDVTGKANFCDAVLVTVPLTILQETTMRFVPKLPVYKINAINGIGMDKGMKLIMKFRRRWWPEEMYNCVTRGYTSIFWAPGKVFGDAENTILTAYIMGERYSYMSAMNEEATQVVLVELDRLYGKGFATDYFVDAFIMDWGKEESFHGVYSYPMVGTYCESGLSKRQLLAEPIDNRVFFAGEATSNEHSATVHGALESGSRAAEEIIRIFLPQ